MFLKRNEKPPRNVTDTPRSHLTALTALSHSRPSTPDRASACLSGRADPGCVGLKLTLRPSLGGMNFIIPALGRFYGSVLPCTVMAGAPRGPWKGPVHVRGPGTEASLASQEIHPCTRKHQQPCLE